MPQTIHHKHHITFFESMGRNYYDSDHLRQFPKVTELSEKLGTKFFDYYNSVFEGDELTAREKSLIALAVAHTVQCPYCIDAYTEASMQHGVSEGGMMEAVHVACAIRGGASLVHGVQMMNQAKKAGM
jgi:alkylhydroperoxidase/carboxymuconolactone decarboxylase family protein